MDFQTIISISKEVRNEVLLIAKNKDLFGYCVIASNMLYNRLNKLEIKCTIWDGKFRGYPHTWIICNGHIIDLTSSQFKGMPEINVVKAYIPGCGYVPISKVNYETV